MTDDAYLVLFDDPAVSLGVPLAAVEDASFLDTAGRAGVAGGAGRHRDVAGAAAAAAGGDLRDSEDAERLPVPLGDEELIRVRQLNAPYDVAKMEEELLAYRSSTEGREALLTRAVAVAFRRTGSPN